MTQPIPPPAPASPVSMQEAFDELRVLKAIEKRRPLTPHELMSLDAVVKCLFPPQP